MMNEECVAVTKQLVHDGLACCVLKGQGNLVNHPEDLRDARNPGDIDVWCWPQDPCGMEIAVSDLDGKGAHYEHYSGARGVIEYALMQPRVAGNPVPEVRLTMWSYRTSGGRMWRFIIGLRSCVRL